VITCTNRHGVEVITLASDRTAATEDLTDYLLSVASEDYQRRVLAWFSDNPAQPFKTNNTIDATPDDDPDADTWSWAA